MKKKRLSELLPEDPLDLRDWPQTSKAIVCYGLCLATPLIIAKAGNLLGLEILAPWGLLNLAVASVLIWWWLVDLFFPRRSIYRFFGRIEGTLKHGLRFWRQILLLTSALLGLGGALAATLDWRLSEASNDPESARYIALLAAAWLASFGWMYTRFEQDRADRVKATLAALREHMTGGATSNLYFDLSVFASEINAPTDRPYTRDELKKAASDIAAFNNRVLQTPTLSDTADQIINSYDRLALGVRQGYFEFDTVNLAIRARLLRIAFRYHYLICDSTDAVEDLAFPKRMRSTKRTWEHFLWLTSRVEAMTTDKVDYRHIVMPPNHIIGTKEGECLPKPKAIKVTTKVETPNWRERAFDRIIDFIF